MIGMVVCALLAKKVKNEQIDLGFLPQLSLDGLKAVEMLKDGKECGLVYRILSGTIGNISQVYDIPIEAFKLDVEKSVYLLFGLGEDRPLLVYQPSAVNQMTNMIIKWNSEGKISESETAFEPISKEPIGVFINSFGENEGSELFGFTCLDFKREKDKKFGKYLIEESY